MSVVHINRGVKLEPGASMYLQSNECVTEVRPDYHERRVGGKTFGYVVEDRHHEILILSQKLELIRDHINQHVEYKPDRVSLSGLYEIISVVSDNPRSRTGGATKNRWFVHRHLLGDLAAAFEEVRSKGFEQTVVLGSKPTVHTQTVTV